MTIGYNLAALRHLKRQTVTEKLNEFYENEFNKTNGLDLEEQVKNRIEESVKKRKRASIKA